MKIPEYDLDRPETWKPLREPYVDPSFDRALIEIAGLNRYGEPNLMRRWGCTWKDPQNASGALKYFLTHTSPTLKGFEWVQDGETFFTTKLADVPASVLIPVPKYESHQLGERRWIIEQYRSPDFLSRSGRYKDVHDTGESELRVSCKNCGSCATQATDNEDERICLSCGSKRMSTVEFREIKNERLLNDFPERGCYDYFLRLQTEDGTANGLYRPCDGKALEDIRRQWAFQQLSLNEQEVEREKLNRMAARERNKRKNAIWAA